MKKKKTSVEEDNEDNVPYFYKEIEATETGRGKMIIKVDKVELTDYYKQIIDEVELKVAKKFSPYAVDMLKYGFCDELGCMQYALGHKYYKYYDYKRRILKKDYGIDYLSFDMLNPELLWFCG